MFFRRLMRGYFNMYVNSQSAGTLAPPSASTVVLPVQYYWQYILDQGPALVNIHCATIAVHCYYRAPNTSAYAFRLHLEGEKGATPLPLLRRHHQATMPRKSVVCRTT